MTVEVIPEMPFFAEEDFLFTPSTGGTQDYSVRAIAHANNFTSTAVRMIYDQRFEMIEQKEWWEDIHIRHRKRINTPFIVILLGFADLFLGISGMPTLLYWGIDLLIIMGAFSVLLTAVLLAMRYRE